MSNSICLPIHKELYNKIKQEKQRLKNKENKKVRSRRKKITMISASRILARKL